MPRSEPETVSSQRPSSLGGRLAREPLVLARLRAGVFRGPPATPFPAGCDTTCLCRGYGTSYCRVVRRAAWHVCPLSPCVSAYAVDTITTKGYGREWNEARIEVNGRGRPLLPFLPAMSLQSERVGLAAHFSLVHARGELAAAGHMHAPPHASMSSVAEPQS